MPVPASDRNLLFGILALQMDFITREALVQAMNAWVLSKAKPLGKVLLEQKALSSETHALLEALVARHMQMHGNDAEKSLASLSAVGSVQEELKKIADPDVQASLGHVVSGPVGNADIYATNAGSVGAPSSAGSRFRVVRPHARGGLGEVFVAQDEELHREVALKQIQDKHADNQDSRTRFMVEAEITGGLEHPGIVPVYGLGQYADGRPYYAMRFIRGDSLKEAIERFHKVGGPVQGAAERNLELRQMLGRFIDVCQAIAYAHTRGVLHRDLKPGNIMLGKFGETLVVDWGLAKSMDHANAHEESAEGRLTLSSVDSSAQTPTVMGSAIGTPQFMSPEQAAGRMDKLGPASDIYCLGATLYSLLTGQPPVTDHDVGEVLRKVERGDFPPPRAVKPDTSRALESICLKALALKPEDRYPSARLLADDIEHWLADEPVSTWKEPWTARAGRWLRRHRTLAASVAAAVLVAAVVLGIATVLLNAAKERESQAKQKAEENYRLARQAVDRYHTEVSENVLLHEPGMGPLRKKLLQAAQEFYQKFVDERGDDGEVKGELGKTLYRLAQITGDIESEKKALDLQRRALAIFQELAAAPPGERRGVSPPVMALDLQSDIALSFYQLGRLYRLTDQLPQSVEAYQQALSVWDRLVSEHAEDRHFRAEQARSHNGLGNVYQVMRRLDPAREEYEKALAGRGRLRDLDPASADYQRDLAVTEGNMGMVCMALVGEEKNASVHLQAATSILSKLSEDHPNITQYRDDLARGYYNLGDLQARLRQPAQAQYHAAADLWDKLAATHPTVLAFRTRLADAHMALAGRHAAAKDFVKAEEACRLSLAIQQKLADDNPDIPKYRGDLARRHFSCGNVYRASGKIALAQAAFQDAVVIQKKLSADWPMTAHYQADLARTLLALGNLYVNIQKTGPAEQAFADSLKIWRQLASTHPQVLEFAEGVFNCSYQLGNLERSARHFPAALDWYSQAVAALAEKRTESESVRQNLCIAYEKRAECLGGMGRHQEALTEWTKALDLAKGPALGWYRLYSTETVARLGRHAEATAAAENIAKEETKSGEALFHLACVYGASVAALANDSSLTEGARADLAELYAARALALLARAEATGYFGNPAHVENLRKNPDLSALQARDDFKKLCRELKAA